MNVTKSLSSVSDFKAGQVVELINDLYLAAQKGAKAVVVKVAVDNPTSTYIKIKWVRNKLSHSQEDGLYYPSSFKVVSMSYKKKLKFLHKNKLISNLEYLEALSEK